jgi:crotonobetainyl-CoA:carnitine CoA-transferase CaiB-like acyl-CoA transferase
MATAEVQEPPLAGVRVLDLTHVLAGPFCTQLLAEAGADVIKIEPPGGEYSRIRGPQRRGQHGSLSSYSAAVNRGKRSLEIDLKSTAGRDLFLRLLARADVVVDNFAPGALERLQLASADLRVRHPRLVTASITLWGVDSRHELARRGGVALVAEAESTLMHYRRTADGAPMHLGFPLGDMSSGLAAYAAIVTALVERERTGIGQHISIGLVRNLLAMNATGITDAQRRTQASGGRAGCGIFKSKDGWVAVGLTSNAEFVRLCECTGQADLATDRSDDVEYVNGIVSEWAVQRTTVELVGVGLSQGIPVANLARPRDVLQDDRFRRFGFLVEVDDGLGGTISVPSSPLGFNFGNKRIPLPREGASEVFQELLGLSASDIDDLEVAGAFGPPPQQPVLP